MLKWIANLISDTNEKELKRLWPLVADVNDLEPRMQALGDGELRALTDDFRRRLASGETLDDILPEAFAAVREVAKRRIGMRHFDVQVLGGIVLHQGKIAEMKTGEGKTLAAPLALYLNALTGKGVHLVTVNDYLAKRDTQWMGPIYEALGLSVGCIQHDSAFIFDPQYASSDSSLRFLRPVSRREAYLADVTYGTNNEFGFDYLRDNMAVEADGVVQRELHYAIVDEVDNILIDEARTPLIISGPSRETPERYQLFARLVPRLTPEQDYLVDERTRSVSLTEEGISKIERWLGVENIYDPANYGLTHFMESALKAHILFKRDRDYVVKDGEVVIVDDFTGRLMFGRRYSEGLHQAIEAKEGVKIRQENVTLATITFQNYFRLYDKLAGMTGTAATEAEELHKIYGLEVVIIPTNEPMIREDHTDLVYKTIKGKFNAVVDEIEELHKQGRPVLVGTVSIESSEQLSDMLRRRGIPHQVLNAKHHEREAAIVAQAGRLGAVTIATNMAGRGTDIILGGNPERMVEEELRKRGKSLDEVSPEERAAVEEEVRTAWQKEHDQVVALGGLHIIGTERHEARRIDNQLRGRSGRQGDPGSSRFYVSLEDDIMRRFMGDWVKGFMDRVGLEEDVPIESGVVTKAIETAQSKVEGYNFDLRKHIVEYDDVMNAQRDLIYSQRREILSGADLRANVLRMVAEEIDAIVDSHLGEGRDAVWDLEGLLAEVGAIFPLPEDISARSLADKSRDEVRERLVTAAEEAYAEREKEFGADAMRALERLVMLQVVDNLWVEHLTQMDQMRQSIGLRAYGQADPLVAYKREAHGLWEGLLAAIRQAIVHTIYKAGVVSGVASRPRPASRLPRAVAAVASGGSGGPSQPVRAAKKVGRNDPCPCGSGLKYKKCCGR